jgi:hypothetical protein
MADIKEIAEIPSREKLLNTIYLLSDLENEIKWSSQKNIMFQTGIIKACIGTGVDGIEELKRKVENLENKLQSGNFTVSNVSANGRNAAVSGNTTYANSSSGTVSLGGTKVSSSVTSKTTANATSSGNSEVNWGDIVNKLKTAGKLRLYTSLVNTKLNQVGDLILEIEFPNGLTPFVQSILDDNANKKELTDLLFRETGKQWHLKYKDGKVANNKPAENNSPINNLGIDINIIE